MDSSMKFFAIATVFLATAHIIFAVCPYAPQPTATYCAGTPPGTNEWDTCTSNGTFKSVSYCYLGNRGYVTRYDYYTCQKTSSGSYNMIKGCCTNQPQTETTNPKGFTDVYNFYNPSTGKCDLPPPTQPPTTAAASDTTASGAVTTPTTTLAA